MPAAALVAGLPPLVIGMLAAVNPVLLVGPTSDLVRTRLVDRPPRDVTDQALTDERLGLLGAHPVAGSDGTAVRQTKQSRTRDHSRGVPVRVSGTALPARVLLAYRNAAADLRSSDPSCHLSWSLLAGIGQVESGQAYGGAVTPAGRTLSPILGPVLDGTGDVAAIRDTDGGRWDGDATWDRAVGPMQFIPSSWAVWGRDGDGDGSANPSDIDDAALATASYLCAGSRDLANLKDRRQAVFSYNHSWDYVDLVLAYAEAYATGHTVVLSPKFGTRGPAKGSNRGVDGGTVVRIVGGGDALAITPGTPLPPGTVVVPPPGTDSPVVVADPPSAPLVEPPPAAAGAEVGPVADTSAQPATTGPSADPSSSASSSASSSPSDSPSGAPSSGPQHTPSPDPTTSTPNPDPTTSSPSPSSDPTTSSSSPSSSPSPTCPTSTPTDSTASPSPPPSGCPTPDASPSDTGSPAASQAASP